MPDRPVSTAARPAPLPATAAPSPDDMIREMVRQTLARDRRPPQTWRTLMIFLVTWFAALAGFVLLFTLLRSLMA